MYHIKDDKRAYKSAQLIYAALYQCLQQKEFTKITIQDIQQASSVSRATFYRHFDSLIDVLHWRCDQQFAEVWTGYQPAPHHTAYHFTQYLLTYWANHSEILEILLSIHRPDIIYTCHMNNLTLFQEKYSTLLPMPLEHSDYFMGIRTGMMIGVLMTWLQNGKQESAEEICTIIQAQMEFLRQTKLII